MQLVSLNGTTIQPHERQEYRNKSQLNSLEINASTRGGVRESTERLHIELKMSREMKKINLNIKQTLKNYSCTQAQSPMGGSPSNWTAVKFK